MKIAGSVGSPVNPAGITILAVDRIGRDRDHRRKQRADAGTAAQETRQDSKGGSHAQCGEICLAPLRHLVSARTGRNTVYEKDEEGKHDEADTERNSRLKTAIPLREPDVERPDQEAHATQQSSPRNEIDDRRATGPAQSKSSLARRKARDEGREHERSATRDEREKEAHPGGDRQRGQRLFLHVGHQLIFDIPRIGAKFLYLGLALGT